MAINVILLAFIITVLKSLLYSASFKKSFERLFLLIGACAFAIGALVMAAGYIPVVGAIVGLLEYCGICIAYSGPFGLVMIMMACGVLVASVEYVVLKQSFPDAVDERLLKLVSGANALAVCLVGAAFTLGVISLPPCPISGGNTL